MKKTAYVIGIDIGTQGTKAGLFDASGVCYAEAYEASALLHPAPGAVEQDPDALYASVLHTVREVLEKSGAARARCWLLAWPARWPAFRESIGNGMRSRRTITGWIRGASRISAK